MDYSAKEDSVELFFDKLKLLIIPSESNNFKSRLIQSKTLFYCVALLLVLKIAAVLFSINLPPNIFFADITKSVLQTSLNQTRQSLGLNPLAENQKLNAAAQLKAENMVQNQYFNHVSPTGVTPWFWFLKAGYQYKYAGENLAIGFYDSEEVFNAWLNSPSHKANILNPNYTEVGTAVLGGFGQANTIVVVQEFGSRLPTKQPLTKTENTKPVAVQPKTAPVNSAPATETQGKVLSQSTESISSLAAPSDNVASNFPSKILNSALYNYGDILQKAIYGVSLLVIGILITLIFFNFNITFRKDLVFRAVLIVAVLSIATLINKDMILAFIPHQILI